MLLCVGVCVVGVTGQGTTTTITTAPPGARTSKAGNHRAGQELPEIGIFFQTLPPEMLTFNSSKTGSCSKYIWEEIFGLDLSQNFYITIKLDVEGQVL